MREHICIVCPRGCRLLIEEKADGSLDIRGNACARGPVWAESEIRDPRRTVTATCRLFAPAASTGAGTATAAAAAAAGPGAAAARPEAPVEAPSRLPVRSSAPCPRPLVPELLADIYRLEVRSPVAAGQVLIENWRGLGIDVVATADG